MNAHASARARWLERATAALAVEPAVIGAALVGSLGRGDGDNWSDVDLLVFVDGDPSTALDHVVGALGDVASQLDAPHNTRADAASFGAIYVVDGLPLQTDWYVFPKPVAAWPSDSTPIVGVHRAQTVDATFLEVNGSGPRGRMPTVTPDRLLHHEMLMTIVEAKNLARRRAAAAELVPLRDRLAARRDAAPMLVAAIERYLDLVATSG